MVNVYQFIHLVQNIFFILVGLFGIGFLIGFHELGHFIFCKIFKIRTPSFSIGMGPRILTKKIGETEFALSAIPLGGYVEIAGAAEVGQGDQKQASSRDQYSFASKPYWQKLLVMIGGILFNLMFAYIVFSGLYYIGMPKSPLLYPSNATTTIEIVAPDSPAQKFGLHAGDKIVGIDTQTIANPAQVIEYIQDKANTEQAITVQRGNEIIELHGTIGERQTEYPKRVAGQTIMKKGPIVGFLGVDFLIPRYSFIDSILMGIKSTHLVMKQVANAFKGMFVDRNIEQVGGPLMVISQTIKGAEKGIKIFLLLLAFISINLALLNIIPVPIMDGGQILFYTIEAIIRRPLPDKVRIYIHYVCWIAVLLLVVYLSVKDVLRMIGW